MRLYISFVPMLVLSAAVANAAPPTPSEVLIEDGIALRLKGQHQDALELFQKAHALSPSARTLAQMGLAEASLHHWVEAEGHLTAALASHDTPWIENAKNREVLDKTLGVIRSHIGLVAVVGPAGADITVDGRLVGRLPLPAPLHISEGRVRIEGTAQGRQSASADLTVPGGQELTVRLELPLAVAPAPPTVQEQLPAPLLDAHPVAESVRWKTWTGSGLLAVSAGLLGSGIVWIAIDGSGTCDPPANARCARLYDTKAQGWIAAGAGVVAGVAGGFLLWQARQSETRLSLAPGLLTASGTF